MGRRRGAGCAGAAAPPPPTLEFAPTTLAEATRAITRAALRHFEATEGAAAGGGAAAAGGVPSPAPPGASRWQLHLSAAGGGQLATEVLEMRSGRWRSRGTLASARQVARHSCHTEDSRADHACTRHGECGVSGEGCVQRRCSAFGFCYSPGA